MSLLRRIESPLGATAPTPISTDEPRRAPTYQLRDPAAQISQDLKGRVQNRLISELDPKMDLTDTVQVRRVIEELFNSILESEGVVLVRSERQRLFEQVVAEILGYGPLEPLLQDPTITEVMVNGPKMVFIERSGKIEHTNVAFQDDEHVMRIIDRIIAPLGRRCDESQPMADARLPDGSRVNAIIPPLSLTGPVLTIRKFSKKPLTTDDLIRFGSVTAEAVEFLKACVYSRLNVVVSGGTGSGKTTLLNVLSSFIPDDERIVTIEDAAELQLRQDHAVTLESRPANIEGRGQIAIRDLVRNALRMRPDRIVVGEVRGHEVLPALLAATVGSQGSMTTVHARSAGDVWFRFATFAGMGPDGLSFEAAAPLIAGAVDLIIHLSPRPVTGPLDAPGAVTSVHQVTGHDQGRVTTEEVVRVTRNGTVEARARLSDAVRARLEAGGWPAGELPGEERW